MSWSALGKLKFERAQLFFGVCKQKQSQQTNSVKLNLYQHPLYTRQRFSSEGLHVESYPRDFQRVFGGQRCVKRRLLRTLGDEGVSNDMTKILSAVLDTHHCRNPAEEGQKFCPPFQDQTRVQPVLWKMRLGMVI